MLDKPPKSTMFIDDPKHKLKWTYNFSVASHELPTWNFGIQTAVEKETQELAEEINEVNSTVLSFLQQVQEKGPALT